jgi:hypothetical protein
VSEAGSPFAPPPPPAPPPAGPVLQTTMVAPPPSWSSAPARGATLGSLLDRTISTWKGAFLPFAGLGLLYQAVLLSAGFALGSPINPFTAQPFQPPTPEVGAWAFTWRYWAFMVGTYVLTMLFSGALTAGAIQHLAGRRPTLGGMLGAMGRRVPTLVGAGLLAILAIYGGMILLIVPGIMWGLSFSLSTAVVMAEPLGAVASMKRSAALAKGSRWTLLGLFLVCLLATFLPNLLAWGLGTLVPALGGAITLVAGVCLGPLLYAAPAVAYHDLRVAKEGARTEELARVFE